MNYPMIGDVDFNVSKLYGMLPASASLAIPPRLRRPTTRRCATFSSSGRTRRSNSFPGLSDDHRLQLRRGAAGNRHRSSSQPSFHKVATRVNWKKQRESSSSRAHSLNDDDAPKTVSARPAERPSRNLRIMPQPKGVAASDMKRGPGVLGQCASGPLASFSRRQCRPGYGKPL